MHFGQRAALAVLTATTLAAVLAGCSGKDPGDTSPAVRPGSGTGEFAQIDAATRGLVSQRVAWQAPGSLDVEETARIGLSIGEGRELTDKIETLLRGTQQTPVGEMRVGPSVRATLRGSSEDVEITPSESVNASTGSDVQMLFTWLIKAKQPTDDLQLTAHLEVPLSNGHVITHEVPLSIQVHRTAKFTVWQVLTNWGTWSAVVTSLIAVVGWLVRRRRREAAAEEAPEPSVSSTADAVV
ncbi:hypothetical protein [Catellatospora sp. NPDC049609]|uniref:hypothetical protein n=1 Tax=Catellatospora sp. NPDC049609 TaxID=3155505 RepID=UPI00341C106D